MDLKLGNDKDSVELKFNQNEINNINLLLKTLKARLSSEGEIKTKDEAGNDVVTKCDIYSLEFLVIFLYNSLSFFNQMPTFTSFTFNDTKFVEQFHEIIAQGALIYALASKALVERGREFIHIDNGISFVPPAVSNMLYAQYKNELDNYMIKIREIKHVMTPAIEHSLTSNE